VTDIAIYDVLGRMIREYPAEVRQAGQHQLRIDGGGLPTGSYWVKLTTESQLDVARVLLIR